MSRVIFPFDGMDLKQMQSWCSRLKGQVAYVKIGLEAFIAYGKVPLSIASNYRIPIMFDLKLLTSPQQWRRQPGGSRSLLWTILSAG